MKSFSIQARNLITTYAQDEARKLGSSELLPEHVILAVLNKRTGDAYACFIRLKTNIKNKPTYLEPEKIELGYLSANESLYYYFDYFYKEKNALEQVDDAITNLTKKRTDLDNTRIECIKSMILNNNIIIHCFV